MKVNRYCSVIIFLKLYLFQINQGEEEDEAGSSIGLRRSGRLSYRMKTEIYSENYLSVSIG